MKSIISTFLFMISLTAIAQIEWQRKIGSSLDERGYDGIEDAAGNIFVVATTNGDDLDVSNNIGSYDLWLVKLNSKGSIAWEKSFGDTLINQAYAITAMGNNKYLIAGVSQNISGTGILNNDGWLIAIDSSGNELWQNKFGGVDDDFIRDVEKINDNLFVAAGYARSTNGDIDTMRGIGDGWLLWVDSLGNTVQSITYGGSSFEEIYAITYANGKIYGTGRSRSNDGMLIGNQGNYDTWLLTTDSLGGSINNYLFGGTADEIGKGIMLTSDNHILIVSDSYSDNGDITNNYGRSDYWLLKLNLNANIQWSKSFGGTRDEFVEVVEETTDGNYILAGISLSFDGLITDYLGGIDAWMVKCDPNGSFIWDHSAGGSSDEGVFKFMNVTNGMLLIGDTDSRDNDLVGVSKHLVHDIWVAKYSNIDVVNVEDVNVEQLNIYPNPATQHIIIENYNGQVDIFNQLGKAVSQQFVNEHLNVMDLPTGIYLVRLNTDATFKFIKQP